jgi:hypothetical protein
VASQAAALRDEIQTVAPCCKKPVAIMRPMPREPPVTRAVRPSRLQIGFMGVSWVSALCGAALTIVAAACAEVGPMFAGLME